MCGDGARVLSSQPAGSGQVRNSTRKLILYSVIAWTIPLVMVIVTIILNYTTSDLIRYGWNEGLENSSYWINHFLSAVLVFLVPIVACICLQCILFFAFVILFCTSCQNKTVSSGAGKTKSPPYFRLFFALFFASNLLWVSCFIPLMLMGSEWAWYPFIILQSLQGFIIFIGFFCSRKVFHLYSSVFK